MKSIKKLFAVIITTALLLTVNTPVSLHANSQDEGDKVYMERGQFSLASKRASETTFSANSFNNLSNSVNTDISFDQFLNSNPEIKDEIIANQKKGLVLEDIAFTKVYLKEITDENGVTHYQPMTESEYNRVKNLRVKYNNLTLTIQYYSDSWNKGNATVNLQAVWPSGLGIDGGQATVTGSTDDYMAFVVAQNHDINTHGMYGVAQNVNRHALSEKGVAYRFKERTGSQTLTTNTTYYSYNRKRVFSGSYVHTWASVNVSFGLSLGGPSVSISNSSKAWNLPVELRKDSD